MKKNIFIPDYLQIPNQVFIDRKLSGIDMLVYGVIYWHTKLKGDKCFASNQTIGEIVGAKSNKISESISRLEKGGYIQAVYTDKTKRQRKELIPLVEYQKRVILRSEIPDTPNGDTPDTPNGEQNKNIVNKNIKEELSQSDHFDTKQEIQKMRDGNRKDLKIIALYWSKKGYEFENKVQFQKALRRDLRPANTLIGYTGIQIAKAIQYCQREYPVWTLETINKRITDLVNVKN